MNNISAKENENIETIENKIVKLPEELKKSIKTIFTSGCDLKNLICRNKSELFPNSFPGVYQLDCTCNAPNISETKKNVITRTIEHQHDSCNRKWESSSTTEHCLECHRQFN